MKNCEHLKSHREAWNMRGTPWADEAVRLYQSGQSIASIAAAMRVCCASVYRVFSVAKIKLRSPVYRVGSSPKKCTLTRDEIRSLRAAGKSLRKIAVIAGVSYERVRQVSAQRAEIARAASAAKLSHKGGRPRSCDCGTCKRCRARASEQRSWAKVAK
jgi:uncharacterized protein YhbP (UPF0306 family)